MSGNIASSPVVEPEHNVEAVEAKPEQLHDVHEAELVCEKTASSMPDCADQAPVAETPVCQTEAKVKEAHCASTCEATEDGKSAPASEPTCMEATPLPADAATAAESVLPRCVYFL